MGAELELSSTVTSWLLLASLPLLLSACTAYTKISIVLAALRTGLGAQRLLPFGSILALALVLTAVVMAPVAERCLLAVELGGGLEALREAPLEAGAVMLEPLWDFLAAHADGDELEFFAEWTGQGEGPAVLVPAFLLGELGRGLELAVMILVPFLVVDLICAQLLVLLGLANLPASVVALPAKVLLFLAADGWHTVVAGLLEGYR